MDSIEDLERFLAKTVLLGDLSQAHRQEVAHRLERLTLARGDVLFEAGAAGDSAFLVRSGLVHVVDAAGKVLAEIKRGEHLGEMAVLTGEPRAASAVAAMDSVLYRLPGEVLCDLFQEHPRLYANLSRTLMRNLQQRPRGLRGIRTAALVGVGSAASAVLDLARELVREVSATDGSRTAVLDCLSDPRSLGLAGRLAGELDDVTLSVRTVIGSVEAEARGSIVRLREATDAGDSVAALVAELRGRFDRVIVVAALPWSDGARRAVAQCEAFYRVASEGDLPAAARAAEADRLAAPATGRAPRVLALERCRGAGLRSLAREVAGRRTALVLGAGGAKGFAHVGALRAFERHGVEFDAVAGASIGAIVGALHAAGNPAAEVSRILFDVAARKWSALLDFTLPTEAFFRSRKKTELIREHCGERQIESLPIPFRAIAGDLVTLSQFAFRSGPLAVALDASSAIPIVFRPVRFGESILIDGWGCNPLPADVVRAEGFERVVAVDLSFRSPDPGALSARSKRSTGMDRRFRILAIAMRSMEVGSREHVARSLPLIDVLVRPDLDEFSSVDLDAADEICERGEKAAEAAVASLRDV